jgi:hypothetical protein
MLGEAGHFAMPGQGFLGFLAELGGNWRRVARKRHLANLGEKNTGEIGHLAK